MAELEWVFSQGGPLVAVPGELASTWRGVLPPAGVAVPPGWTWGTGGVVCDYDRACDDTGDEVTTGDSLGAWTVDVGCGRALVLEGETSTTSCPSGRDLVLLRNAAFETVEQAERFVAAIAPAQWLESTHELSLPGGRLLVFDAATPGATCTSGIDAEGGVLELLVEPGVYHLHYAAPVPPGDRLTLIRLSMRR